MACEGYEKGTEEEKKIFFPLLVPQTLSALFMEITISIRLLCKLFTF